MAMGRAVSAESSCVTSRTGTNWPFPSMPSCTCAACLSSDCGAAAGCLFVKYRSCRPPFNIDDGLRRTIRRRKHFSGWNDGQIPGDDARVTKSPAAHSFRRRASGAEAIRRKRRDRLADPHIDGGETHIGELVVVAQRGDDSAIESS